MKILLITNNERLINRHLNEVNIINSILLGVNDCDSYDYIIIDEQNLEIETNCLDQLEIIKNKIAILGYTPYKNYIFIHKEEFNIENIELYFHNLHYESDEIGKANYELELQKIRHMEMLSDESKNIKDSISGLSNYCDKYRKELYSYLPRKSKMRILIEGNTSMKWDLIKKLVSMWIDKYKSKYNSNKKKTS